MRTLCHSRPSIACGASSARESIWCGMLSLLPNGRPSLASLSLRSPGVTTPLNQSSTKVGTSHMRRGLMAWNKDEIPIDILRERVRRLQDAMAQASVDGILLYTNFIRSGAVSYLTAFSPYWADGVLLVPRQGEPLFATTL